MPRGRYAKMGKRGRRSIDPVHKRINERGESEELLAPRKGKAHRREYAPENLLSEGFYGGPDRDLLARDLANLRQSRRERGKRPRGTGIRPGRKRGTWGVM